MHRGVGTLPASVGTRSPKGVHPDPGKDACVLTYLGHRRMLVFNLPTCDSPPQILRERGKAQRPMQPPTRPSQRSTTSLLQNSILPPGLRGAQNYSQIPINRKGINEKRKRQKEPQSIL